jgi:HK97 gp10 family phage protein
VTISADFSGLNHIAIELGAVSAVAVTQARVALERTAYAIEADAKSLAPVDTGNLKSSIATRVFALTAEVGPTAEYGGYVEEGTSRMAPQPYMGPAFDRRAPELADALANLPGL